MPIPVLQRALIAGRGGLGLDALSPDSGPLVAQDSFPRVMFHVKQCKDIRMADLGLRIKETSSEGVALQT